MATVYVISGGGQQVRQNAQKGLPTTFKVVENSDWPATAQCCGQDHYANTLWATDVVQLQAWANGWAGKRVKLIEGKID